MSLLYRLFWLFFLDHGYQVYIIRLFFCITHKLKQSSPNEMPEPQPREPAMRLTCRKADYTNAETAYQTMALSRIRLALAHARCRSNCVFLEKVKLRVSYLSRSLEQSTVFYLYHHKRRQATNYFSVLLLFEDHHSTMLIIK